MRLRNASIDDKVSVSGTINTIFSVIMLVSDN